MHAWHYLVILACVAGIAAGQVLFKYVAGAISESPALCHRSVLVPLAIAFFTYALVTVGWILTLRFAPLNKAYPFMALSFVFVPAASWLLFGEKLDLPYMMGVGFIVVGVILAGR